MRLTLFTAAGCARCNIAKKFMRERNVAFEEHDAVGEGKERFGQFYRAHRHAVVRGKEGIEFPVLADGHAIRQGVVAVVAYLHSGTGLDGFIGRSELSRGWVGGVNVSAGDPAAVTEVAAVLGILKKNGLKLQLDTDGRNAAVLEHLLGQGLGDRVVMDLKGPGRLYGAMLGAEIQPEEVGRSMMLAARFPEYRFETTVAPVPRSGKDPVGISYLTPEEIAEAAHWLKEATGSHRQPYVLRIFDPQITPDARFRSVEKLPPAALFRHRTAARKFQVLTEIETISP
jgi:pyruvate-formate lyase-activating enzyme/glutaredoxin